MTSELRGLDVCAISPDDGANAACLQIQIIQNVECCLKKGKHTVIIVTRGKRAEVFKITELS